MSWLLFIVCFPGDRNQGHDSSCNGKWIQKGEEEEKRQKLCDHFQCGDPVPPEWWCLQERMIFSQKFLRDFAAVSVRVICQIVRFILRYKVHLRNEKQHRFAFTSFFLFIFFSAKHEPQPLSLFLTKGLELVSSNYSEAKQISIAKLKQ